MKPLQDQITSGSNLSKEMISRQGSDMINVAAKLKDQISTGSNLSREMISKQGSDMGNMAAGLKDQISTASNLSKEQSTTLSNMQANIMKPPTTDVLGGVNPLGDTTSIFSKLDDTLSGMFKDNAAPTGPAEPNKLDQQVLSELKKIYECLSRQSKTVDDHSAIFKQLLAVNQDQHGELKTIKTNTV